MTAHRTSDATVSAINAVAITPADSSIPVTRGIFVGTAGDLEVMMAGGNIVTFVNIANASFLPIQAMQIRAATSASNILALY